MSANYQVKVIAVVEGPLGIWFQVEICDICSVHDAFWWHNAFSIFKYNGPPRPAVARMFSRLYNWGSTSGTTKYEIKPKYRHQDTMYTILTTLNKCVVGSTRSVNFSIQFINVDSTRCPSIGNGIIANAYENTTRAFRNLFEIMYDFVPIQFFKNALMHKGVDATRIEASVKEAETIASTLQYIFNNVVLYRICTVLEKEDYYDPTSAHIEHYSSEYMPSRFYSKINSLDVFKPLQLSPRYIDGEMLNQFNRWRQVSFPPGMLSLEFEEDICYIKIDNVIATEYTCCPTALIEIYKLIQYVQHVPITMILSSGKACLYTSIDIPMTVNACCASSQELGIKQSVSNNHVL